MTDLAKLVVRLEAEIGKYSANLDKANAQLTKFARDSTGQLDKLQDRLVAFFTVDAAIEWGKHILEAGDRLSKLSQSSGIAVEDLSRLEYGLKASGVAGENTGKIFRTLNEEISDAAGNAKGDAAQAFKAIGVSVRDASGQLKTADQVLSEIADRFKGYQDGANKSALATELFKKQGDAIIPFLNQGADGIQRLKEESDRLGATWTGETAAAAEAFNDKIGRLKTLLVDGIGQRIAQILLPSLNEMGDEFEDNVGKIDALNHVADIAATALKLIASAALIVGSTFDKVGETIGAVTAAQVEFFSGNFRESAHILADYFVRGEQDAENFQKRMKAIWADGGDGIVKTIKDTASKVKAEAPNLAANKEIEKAAEAAIKRLMELNNTLGEQVKTFGLGEGEALRYRLTVGNLADDVAAAGAAGDKLRDSILAQGDALQKLKDTKEIRKGLADVATEIEKIRGNEGDAAAAAFDAKYNELVTKLRREGDDEGQRQLETLLQLQVAQADYNEAEKEAARIQGELATIEERLRNSREAGALTELGYQKQLAEARGAAAVQLDGIYEKEQKIATQIGNPETTAAVERFGASIETLKGQVDVVANSFRAAFEDTFADELLKAEKGVESLGEAFGNMLEGLADQLLKLANQQLAQQLIGAVAGSNTTGGGYLSTILGAFGGGKAAGGPVLAGHEYTINEGTADRRERFIPAVNGRIERAGGGRALTVEQTFVLQTERGGTVSRQTQMQMGSVAARSLAEAQRRNG